MESYSKSLSELNKKNQELKSKLYDVEVKLGHNVAEKSDIPTESELKSEYINIKSSLEEKNKVLNELNQLKNLIADSKNEIAKEKKSISEDEKKLENLLLDLGNAIFENYTSDLAASFGIQFAEINQEINTIEEMNLQKETLKAEMEKQGFFSKLMTQTKIAGLNLSISSHIKKKEDALRRGAKICLDNDVITKELGGAPYEEAVSLKNSIETSSNRLKLLEDDLVSSEKKLGGYEKEDKLQDSIEDINLDLDNLANQIGHSFAKQYVTRDAEILVDFPLDFEDDLKSVLELRGELKTVHIKSEIVQLSGQIDVALSTIEKMNKEVKDNKAKIEELKDRNKKLTETIKDAETAKSQLEEKKAALEAESKIDIESVGN